MRNEPEVVMRFQCTLRFGEAFTAAAAASDIHDALTGSGWDAPEPGLFAFFVPADPGAVDGPAVALGKKLQGMRCAPSSRGALPAELACVYRDITVFSEHVEVVPLAGGAGLIVPGEPLFSDLMRLRDAMLAALLREHRRV